MTNLTRAMINAVENNIDELELIGGSPANADSVTARQRLQKARSNLAAGKLVTAADSAQSAYDIVEDNRNNNSGCLDFQF